MSDAPGSGPTVAHAPPQPATAGGLLRQARQTQGLHIAALAAAIKVTPRKLELLESDQFDQLTDATFTRALAQAVCRTLKIDAAPILALLPPLLGHRLEQVAQGLNTPFLERPGRLVPKDWADLANPVLWIAGLIVVVTLVVYLVPADWIAFSGSPVGLPDQPTASPPAVVRELVVSEPVAPATAASEAVGGVLPQGAAASVPALPLAPDAVTAAATSGVVQFRTTAESWVEVTDARGQTLIGRVLQPGESVGLDGVMPLKVRIGNAGGTQVFYQGQPFGLAAHTRDNVARLELK